MSALGEKKQWSNEVDCEGRGGRVLGRGRAWRVGRKALG